jgi:hypothetical protein
LLAPPHRSQSRQRSSIDPDSCDRPSRTSARLAAVVPPS